MVALKFLTLFLLLGIDIFKMTPSQTRPICFVLFLFSKTIDGCHGYIVFKYQDMAVVNIYIAFIYIFLKIES